MSYEIGAALAGGALGTIGNLLGQNSQNQQTAQFMEIQQQNQMELNEQMQQIQQENWDYTNAENQVKHYKNAGLNVGLMYGGSGAGGTTMGGGAGGSAAMGQAAQSQNYMEMSQQILQAKSIETQTKLNEAQEEKLKAEAEEIRKRTPGGDKNLGDITYEDIKQTAKGKELANSFATANFDNSIALAKQQLEESKARTEKDIQEGKINEIEANNRQAKLSQEIALMSIEEKLKKHQIALTDEQKRAIGVELAQGWEKLSLENDKNKIDFNNALTNHFRLELDKILGPASLDTSERNATKQAISHLAGSILMTGAMSGQFTPKRAVIGGYGK